MQSLNTHLVIPAYNESRRICDFLESLLKEAEKAKFGVKVLVVDDGSEAGDGQRLADLVFALSEKHPGRLQLVKLPANKGKGAAVRHGWDLAENADYIAFIDADGSVSAKEAFRLLGNLSDGVERCLLGSRIRMLGKTVERTFLRHVNGRIFSTLVSLITGIAVYDSQCGFKVLPLSAYKKIRHLLKEDRFAFDVELILALDRAGFRMEEIPIDWFDVSGSKVSLIRDSVNMFFAVRKITRRAKKWIF